MTNERPQALYVNVVNENAMIDQIKHLVNIKSSQAT